MSASLADFRLRLRSLLGGLRPSDDQLDEGLRWALYEYSLRRPVERTYITAGSGDGLLVLPADFAALAVTRLQRWADDPDEYLELAFHAFRSDEQWLIETPGHVLETSGQYIITYASSHSIDDLDEAAGTSVPAQDETLLALGAAGFVLRLASSLSAA